ncbi:hypothetical protein B0T16DRAFT_461901 [Cercophora newfieldiana]|uniref:Uncharacterized protein n=1 Tax=Cercophora newfieldiana TaxID=92897 RepID=A0AA39XX40_9PEZI|nr:hypothetical protein B0T16DRAFT_461901 [Cercophora newfieldiana]
MNEVALPYLHHILHYTPEPKLGEFGNPWVPLFDSHLTALALRRDKARHIKHMTIPVDGRYNRSVADLQHSIHILHLPANDKDIMAEAIMAEWRQYRLLLRDAVNLTHLTIGQHDATVVMPPRSTPSPVFGFPALRVLQVKGCHLASVNRFDRLVDIFLAAPALREFYLIDGAFDDPDEPDVLTLHPNLFANLTHLALSCHHYQTANLVRLLSQIDALQTFNFVLSRPVQPQDDMVHQGISQYHESPEQRRTRHDAHSGRVLHQLLTALHTHHRTTLRALSIDYKRSGLMEHLSPLDPIPPPGFAQHSFADFTVLESLFLNIDPFLRANPERYPLASLLPASIRRLHLVYLTEGFADIILLDLCRELEEGRFPRLREVAAAYPWTECAERPPCRCRMRRFPEEKQQMRNTQRWVGRLDGEWKERGIKCRVLNEVVGNVVYEWR